MPEYEFEMRAVMKALNASGALPHCIVTGSWAMKPSHTVARQVKVQSDSPQSDRSKFSALTL